MDHLKTLASLTESNRDSGAVAPEPCLSDDDILAFVTGGLHPSREDSVHEHLDSCVVCQKLLTEAAHALDAAPISESARPSWNTVFQPGALIAKRYRLVRLVAKGGMGEVYEAFDTQLHERVALKTVTATHCDSLEAVRLLKAEVQLARRIGHPNVCRIFDLGTHVMEPAGGEIQFLVMEFVEGQCLGHRLRQSGALELKLAFTIAKQLLLGLAAAHKAGILHRDFKSDNVMLRTESNGRITAIVLDFGLAKALNESGTIATTQAHQVRAMVGTIGYMAPEQIEGEPLSAASDVYSLGVVWFEMLTGRLPFQTTTLTASAIARLCRMPEPPSHYNPKVPKWVDRIVLGCLERDRAKRYSSAEQVLAALAAGPAIPEPQPKATKSSRLRYLAPSVGALFIVLALASVAWVRRSSPVPARHAETQRTQATEPIVQSPAEVVARQSANIPGDSPAPAASGSQSKRTKRVRPNSDKASEPPSIERPAPAASALSEATVPSPAQRKESTAAFPPQVQPEPDWLPLGSKPGALSKAQSQVN